MVFPQPIEPFRIETSCGLRSLPRLLLQAVCGSSKIPVPGQTDEEFYDTRRPSIRAASVKHILIGTAGHIDHGKTRLVMRLTGVDTDRLPEEKTRGISIDLGFAHWETEGYVFGVVDVPGHERFIKNMVAGATGVSLALLVVAADDSVMPQTREHLEIMSLLGLRTGVIAVNKIDLVDRDLLELVASEIEDLVTGTFLEGAPIVLVSAETGEGIDELKEALVRAASSIEMPRTIELFRMPIDRSISIPGHGTVVTGSVLSGSVHPGDTLELLPEGRTVRVRSVQNHGTSADDSGAQQRTALNLAGVKHEDTERGMELATPGYLQPTNRLIVELRVLPDSPMPLKDRTELNLHLGTTESLVRVALKGKRLEPGESACAELRTKRPVIGAYGQRFILRRPSPPTTVAGGTLLDPYVAQGKRIKDLHEYAKSLRTSSERDRLSSFLARQDTVPVDPLPIAWRIGIRPSHYEDLLEELLAEGELVVLSFGDSPLRIHRSRLDSLAASVMRTIRQELARHQPRRSLPKNTLLTACRDIAPPQVLHAVFEHLLQAKQLVLVGTNIGPADSQVKLTKNQSALLDTLMRRLADAGLTPPTTKELATELRQTPGDISLLLNLRVEEGLLVQLADGLYFTPQSLEDGRAVCEGFLSESGEATMSQLREAWGVTRKFSVPLCEYFDKIGITVRKGDVRVPGPRIGDTIE